MISCTILIRGDQTLEDLHKTIFKAYNRFDFGDEWLHKIEVTDIENHSGKGKYPKIIKKVGKSPSQYIYENDE